MQPSIAPPFWPQFGSTEAAALSTQADSADADAETSMTEVDEADAHERYREATKRAAQRDAEGSSGSTT